MYIKNFHVGIISIYLTYPELYSLTYQFLFYAFLKETTHFKKQANSYKVNLVYSTAECFMSFAFYSPLLLAAANLGVSRWRVGI